MKSRSLGFTMVEIMIAVVIVAILMAIALPNYRDEVAKSRRIEAVTALTAAAQGAERWYSNRLTYIGPTMGGANSIGDATVPPSGTVYYNISYASTATTYTITATPTGVQSGDACGTYTLNQFGARTVSGSLSRDKCWTR